MEFIVEGEGGFGVTVVEVSRMELDETAVKTVRLA
jgi:hypothetical protein